MIKEFIVGSSWLVFLHFFLSVKKISPQVRNYFYEDYTIVAPLYLGLMNVLGKYLFKTNRFLYTGLLSGLIVAIFNTINRSYNFSPEQWSIYYLYIIAKHVLTFYIIIQSLEKMMQ